MLSVSVYLHPNYCRKWFMKFSRKQKIKNSTLFVFLNLIFRVTKYACMNSPQLHYVITSLIISILLAPTKPPVARKPTPKKTNREKEISQQTDRKIFIFLRSQHIFTTFHITHPIITIHSRNIKHGSHKIMMIAVTRIKTKGKNTTIQQST